MLCAIATRSLAVEGPTAAGPIGGSDIRSAFVPPPGFYAGVAGVVAGTNAFLGGNGKQALGLEGAHLTKDVGGAIVYYVPDFTLFGGSIGFGAYAPFVHQCGHLFAGTSDQCRTGAGDPYVEVDWARYFGTPRASKFAGAFPIFEGLSILAGFGAVIPIGSFTSSDPLSQALSAGTNIVDLAPSLAVTYTTPPIFLEGTEVSGKVYLNNYIENAQTHYQTGRLVNLDFAVTEHIGRVQFGMAGTYAVQLEDDLLFNRPVAIDGRRGELLQLGGITAYDLPEYASSVKLKVTTTAFAVNTVSFTAAVLSCVKKF